MRRRRPRLTRHAADRWNHAGRGRASRPLRPGRRPRRPAPDAARTASTTTRRAGHDARTPASGARRAGTPRSKVATPGRITRRRQPPRRRPGRLPAATGPRPGGYPPQPGQGGYPPQQPPAGYAQPAARRLPPAGRVRAAAAVSRRAATRRRAAATARRVPAWPGWLPAAGWTAAQEEPRPDHRHRRRGCRAAGGGRRHHHGAEPGRRRRARSGVDHTEPAGCRPRTSPTDEPTDRQPTDNRASERSRRPTPTETSEPPSGNAIDLGNGISLTPAAAGRSRRPARASPSCPNGKSVFLGQVDQGRAEHQSRPAVRRLAPEHRRGHVERQVPASPRPSTSAPRS